MTTVEALAKLAESQHVAVIDYRKPGEEVPTRRWVEPYHMQYNNADLIVLCWQLKPEVTDQPHCWRNFRVDRIAAVYDSTKGFDPRREITIHTGEVTRFTMHDPVTGTEPPAEPPPTRAREAKDRATPGTLAAVNRYFGFLEAALMDGKVNVDEKETAHVYASHLSLDQLRAAHAQVYANILREVLTDGTIDFKEEEYLRKCRRALKALGWEP